MDDWKNDLEDLCKLEEECKTMQKRKLEASAAATAEKTEQATSFLSDIVDEAFRKLAAELQKHGRKVVITGVSLARQIEVRFEGRKKFEYRVGANVSPSIAKATIKHICWDKDGKKSIEGGGSLFRGDQERNMSDITQEDIIQDFLTEYKRHIYNMR